MNFTKLLFLSLSLLMFNSTSMLAQGKLNKAIYKADVLLGELEKKEESFYAYKKAMRFAKKQSQIDEISLGMHACAVGLFREGVRQRNNNKPEEVYKKKFELAWLAFKEGEARIDPEKINKYAIYTSAAAAVDIGKYEEARPYLDDLKSDNFGKAKVYKLLVESCMSTNPGEARSLLTEGLRIYPNDEDLRSFAGEFKDEGF